MRVVLIELIARALPQESYQMLDIARVWVGPYVRGVLRGNGLERDEGKEAFPGEEFDHLTELEGIACRTGVIAKLALSVP